MGFASTSGGNVRKSLAELTNWTPKQLQAWDATFTHRYVLYGGARGGGKSRFLRWWCVAWLIWMYRATGQKRIRVMLACETYPDLRDRQTTKIRTEFPEYLGKITETKDDGLCFVLKDHYGGGIIALRNLDDPSKYQSAEFAAICVDEVTKILKDTFDILRGSLRWPGIEHTVFLSATNPGGKGHGWVKQLWIDRDFPQELLARAHEFAFIQSLPADNPYLTNSYWDELNSLPPDLRKAWIEGDWTIFAGQFFDQFRTHIHICNPFTIPEGWRQYVGIDYGTTAPFCALFGAVDYDGNLWIYREIYEKGLNATRQAKRILQSMAKGENIYAYIADPSMWAKDQQHGDSFTSIFAEYVSAGVVPIKANNDRIHGWNAVREYLDYDGEFLGDTFTLRRAPRLRIFNTCKNLIRTLPSLVHGETKVEDTDPKCEDHAPDALRYLVRYVYSPTRPALHDYTDFGQSDHGFLEDRTAAHQENKSPRMV